MISDKTKQKKKTQPIRLIKDETQIEVAAASIIELEKAAKRLLSGSLSKQAIALLINGLMRPKDRIGVKKILAVLEAASQLGRAWLKK